MLFCYNGNIGYRRLLMQQALNAIKRHMPKVRATASYLGAFSNFGSMPLSIGTS